MFPTQCLLGYCLPPEVICDSGKFTCLLKILNEAKEEVCFRLRVNV